MVSQPYNVLMIVIAVTAISIMSLFDRETKEFKLSIDPSTERVLPKNSEDKKYNKKYKILYIMSII